MEVFAYLRATNIHQPSNIERKRSEQKKKNTELAYEPLIHIITMGIFNYEKIMFQWMHK